MDLESTIEVEENFCYLWHLPSHCSPIIGNVRLSLSDDEEMNETRLDTNNRAFSVNNRPLQIMDLPPELLEAIFRKLTFENVGKIRLVCQHFNTIGSSLLNSEYNRLRMNMQHRFQNIKAQMPRRESARRKHPLARESDIIETLHMRLTLLHMTFGKHIERKHCCFFAGEILDEVYRILNYVKTTSNLSRAYKVTDELFDLSTMAMEYFKEHIEPNLPEITYFATDFLEYTPTLSSSPKTQVSLLEDSTACSSSSQSKPPSIVESLPSHSTISPTVNKRLRKLRENMKRNNGQVVAVKQELKLTRKKLTSQQKQIQELKLHHEGYDRKFQNTSRKLNAVLQELNRCKMELQYWRSKSPAAQCSCGKVTPVFELKEFDNFAPDSLFEKVSPRRLDNLEDFKPISIEPEAGTSCSGYFSAVPSDRGTPIDNIPVPVVAPVSNLKCSWTEFNSSEGNDLLDDVNNKKLTPKNCKRKLDIDVDEKFEFNFKKVQVSDVLDAVDAGKFYENPISIDSMQLRECKPTSSSAQPFSSVKSGEEHSSKQATEKAWQLNSELKPKNLLKKIISGAQNRKTYIPTKLSVHSDSKHGMGLHQDAVRVLSLEKKNSDLHQEGCVLNNFKTKYNNEPFTKVVQVQILSNKGSTDVLHPKQLISQTPKLKMEIECDVKPVETIT